MRSLYKLYIKLLIEKIGIRSAVPLIKRNAKILNSINVEINSNDINLSLQSKIYMILNNMVVNDIVCKNCGVPFIQFQNFNLGFKKACSKECSSALIVANGRKTNLIRYGVESTNSLPDIKNKKKNIITEKYGVESYTQTDEFKNKSRKTKKNRYGDENFNNTEKNKNTCLIKYGVDSYSKTEECKKLIGEKNKLNSSVRLEKMKKTNYEEYGDEFYNLKKAADVLFGIYGGYPLQNKFVLDKTRQSMIDKFGKQTPFEIGEIQDKIKINNVAKYGFENYMHTIEGKNKVKEAQYTNYKKKLLLFGYELLDDCFIGVKKNTYSFKCNTCGNTFNDKVEWRMPRCPVCMPSNVSVIESEIRKFLISEHIDFISNSRSLIPPLEIDIFMPEFGLGIELNGIYYHTEISGNKDRKYHYNKCSSMLQKGYNLIQFTDSDWIGRQDLIKSMILSKTNNIKNIKYARKLKIIEISTKEKNSFLDINHYQGADRSVYKFGLYDYDGLCCVMTFIEKNNELYLSRFATKKFCTVVGGFSKLLCHMEKNYSGSCEIITTHADRRISVGNVYLKNGFSVVALQAESYEYTKNYRELYHRSNYMKEKIKNDNGMIFNDTMTEWENMKMNNFDRMWDAGKIKFKKEIKK